jgi:preprotein translocase subunit SecB
MKAKASPLQLLDFTVFVFKLDSIHSDDPQNIHLQNLPIEIDFDIFEPKENLEDDDLRIIEMKIAINKTRKKPGYYIALTASGVFAVDTVDKLSHDEKENLLGISTINMMVSNIRGFLKNVTSYSPYGHYILPSVDMKHLIQEKNKQDTKYREQNAD